MLADRIARARAFAGFSLRELADRAGVSHTAIARYERGVMMPGSDVLLAIARATGVRVEFFFRTDTVASGPPAWRVEPRVGSRALARVEAVVVEQAERLFEAVALFPEAPVPAFVTPHLPRITTPEGAEQAAEALRTAWELGDVPIACLTATLEDRGLPLLVVSEILGVRGEARSLRLGDVVAMVVTEGVDGARQRLAVARELGQLLLGAEVASELVDRFARALLVPRTAVVEALGTRRRRLELRELLGLRQAWGLSMADWIVRARDVGVLDERAAGALQRELRSRGWNEREPGTLVSWEKPSLLRRLVLRALGEDLIGESKAAELLGEAVGAFRSWLRLEEAPEQARA